MEIYEPAEDSYLMSNTLKKELPKLLSKNPGLRFLEIGCGSGINLLTAKKAGVYIENVLGTDINEEAVRYCNDLGFNCIKSDLFDNVIGKFDVIIFNPPYLPEDENEPRESRVNTTAGKKGNEIIVKFLKQAKKHLNEDGKIFLITSSLSKEIDLGKLGYKAKLIAEKKLFFELLSVTVLDKSE